MVKKKVEKKLIGKVMHWYDKISVAVIELTGALKQGDKISIEGHDVVEQKVKSMQIDNQPVKEAKKGQAIGLKVDKRVWEKDSVYKVE